MFFVQNLPARTEVRLKINGNSLNSHKDSDIILGFEPQNPSIHKIDRESEGDIPFSGPLQVSGSSGFAWARRRFDDYSSIRSRSRSSSKSLVSEPWVTIHSKEPNCNEKIERTSSRGRDYKVKNRSQLERPKEFDGGAHGYPSRDLSMAVFKKIDLVSSFSFSYKSVYLLNS